MLNTNIRMLIRQDAILEMQQLNPVPNRSEMIIVAPDPDTGRPVKFAFGDGVTHYNSLVFYDFPTTGSGETITVVNNLTATVPGSALDAVQGKILNETKANIDSPDFTGTPKTGGVKLATINDIPSKLSTLTNDVGFIINSVDSLINYYTKTQVNDLFANFSSLNILIVAVLPTENISATTIYLVPKNPAQSDNIYTEYIRVSNKWEIIGDTSVDLSDYLKKAGDGSDVTSTISEQTGVANLISGEKLSVMFGKIQKWIEYLNTRTIPAGGNANQILAKSSATNYEVTWVDPPQSAVIPENVVYFNNTIVPTEVIVMAGDSLKFGGQLPVYYAKQSDLNNTNTELNNINTELNNINTELNKRTQILKDDPHGLSCTGLIQNCYYDDTANVWHMIDNTKKCATLQCQNNGHVIAYIGEWANNEIKWTGGEVLDASNYNKYIGNPNLLHNWDFRNPVNQRGQSSYSGSFIYTIDRWIIAGGTATISTNGVTINGMPDFFQKYELGTFEVYVAYTSKV